MQRVAKGETKPSRLNFEQPVPRSIAPVKPQLAPAAEALWDRIVADAPPGMLTSLDSELLRMYCETVVTYVTYRPVYERAPVLAAGTFLDAEGKRHTIMHKSPMHQVIRDSIEVARLLARELGFSPAARMGMHMTVAASAMASDGMDDIIGRPARLRVIEGRKASATRAARRVASGDSS